VFKVCDLSGFVDLGFYDLFRQNDVTDKFLQLPVCLHGRKFQDILHLETTLVIVSHADCLPGFL
jgi:hypothetical protein